MGGSCRTTLLSLALLVSGSACRAVSATEGARRVFPAPEAAVERMVAHLRRDDVEALQRLLGPTAGDVIDSGDPVADREGRRRFLELYDEAHRIEMLGNDRAVLYVGDREWPFPIPVVRDGATWFLDAAEGREELLDRRIGRNELTLIQVALALVDAQEEYASEDRDGDGILEYAAAARSTPGRRDGLYWPAPEGEPPSPLGELAAMAAEEGYEVDRSSHTPVPFHGYYLRWLHGQGEYAPGGAYDYSAGGHRIGGFAVVAYPAAYGISGVMTFLVSHAGVVYQKDLGPETEDLARAMSLFDPDEEWSAVPTADLELIGRD